MSMILLVVKTDYLCFFPINPYYGHIENVNRFNTINKMWFLITIQYTISVVENRFWNCFASQNDKVDEIPRLPYSILLRVARNDKKLKIMFLIYITDKR